MADLSVIIVSFNSEPFLSACLSSVYAHAGGASVEVVVVDNDSADGSVALVERNFPTVRVVRNENRGFAHANNRGLEVTDAPYVLFANPDVEILDGSFSELVEHLERRPGVGLLGCRQLDEEMVLFPTIRRFPTPLRLFMQALGTERLGLKAQWAGERVLDVGVYDAPQRCDWLTGSFMLARREAVIAAGMMDERYFLFSEETDLCVGIQREGWEVWYDPQMTILHHFGKNGYSRRLLAQEAYARRQYMFKHDSVGRRALGTSALALFYGRKALDSVAHGSAGTSRRAASLAALRTVLGISPPPFGDRSGPLRGSRRPPIGPKSIG